MALNHYFELLEIESILIPTMRNTFEMVSDACETNMIKNANFIKCLELLIILASSSMSSFDSANPNHFECVFAYAIHKQHSRKILIQDF